MQVYQPSEEEIRQFTDPYQSTVCSECQEAGDERLLLLCDGCDAAAHTYCVGLGRTVPRGDWFCSTCSVHVQGFSSDDQGHEEGTDGESSSPLHILFITQVQQQQPRQPPHRPAAPRLNRAGSRCFTYPLLVHHNICRFVAIYSILFYLHQTSFLWRLHGIVPILADF